MSIHQFETKLEDLGEEVVKNIKDPKNATLLIIGTETEKGVLTRMYCNNPHMVAGILFNQAISTGDFKTINEMIKALDLISIVAKSLIEKELIKRNRNN